MNTSLLFCVCLAGAASASACQKEACQISDHDDQASMLQNKIKVNTDSHMDLLTEIPEEVQSQLLKSYGETVAVEEEHDGDGSRASSGEELATLVEAGMWSDLNGTESMYSAMDIWAPPSDGWSCTPTNHFTFWPNYCSTSGYSKSWAMSADCSYAWYRVGDGIGVTEAAIMNCESGSGKRCYTYDNNGRHCLTNGCHAGALQHSRSNWQNYCSYHTTNKAWFTTESCDSFGWASGGSDPVSLAKSHCEQHAGVGKCRLIDDGGKTLAPNCMPACQQRFSQWCWATAAASLVSYWKPHSYVAEGKNSCMGVSCVVASAVTGHSCCVSHGTTGGALGWNHACNQPKSLTPVATWLKQETGKNYVYEKYRPTKAELEKILKRGPIVVRIGWHSGGGHFLTMGGTNGKGDFWVHDPWNTNQAGKYEILTYDQVVEYTAPGDNFPGSWDWSLYIHEVKQCHCGILNRAAPFNFFWCSDGQETTMGHCPANQVCFATTPFPEGQWHNGCRVP